ncbi:VirB4 family type IV secretion/conjugal transfer ATPase [Rickettsia asembonensis]|uniref:Type IV secretion system protein virB4 n=1 Tax=Rickettsia asembonensis TaxID=1068590 RepID=A0A0C2M0U6_9RICK|nr:VirB4 family type IV secretion/conjugal transfer ATPase [Rickettsia asembonensis]KIJ89342.1 type IV secretion system ATPase VirB4 [Rickettsia asembonensis]
MKLFRTRAAKELRSKQERPTSHFIPYKCHWDSNTILTKDNSLLQVIKINGFSFETADDEDLDIKKNIRNALLKNMASGNIVMYFHTIRRRKAVIFDDTEFTYDPTVKVPNDFITYLGAEWRKRHAGARSFFNELYVSILYKPDTGGAAIVEYFLKKLRQKSNKTAWENDMKEMKENLQEMSTRVVNTFRSYGARLLGVRQTQSGSYCEILEFLSSLINCGDSPGPIALPRGTIDEYLPTHRLFFDSRTIEARSPLGKKYAGMISILEYGPNTSAGIFDGFLQMPFEFVMTQSFVFANRTIAIGKMQLQQNRMIQSGDKATSQIAEINTALDMATSGDIGFGEHHLSLLCSANNIKALEDILSMAAVELSNSGIQPVREKVNMEPSYWGQLPGNMDYIVRKSTINTLNMASFASQHNYPLGKIRDNHWGEYVTVLDTTSGTPFYFNFHVRDVGHTLIIGPTGAGKTVLMNFLCAEAQKFKPRMFFFDKDRGAEIFIRALNGVYTVIDPGLKCNFNPLQLEDTSENRTFILEWLRVLVTSNGESLTAQDNKILSQAISGNFRLEKKDRKLSNVIAFLGIDTPNSLASRIAMWVGKGSHAKIFDNEVDDIDLQKARVFGFDMTELLKDPVSLAPVLLYVFHRINISLDGQKTMIVLDEAWALIDNPVFAPKIKDWLKVLRKLNTFVIFATQSVEDAAKSRISDTLIQQTATQIFLPNLKATDIYRSAFMLSQREYILIKTTDPTTRYFLIKQGIDAVVAKVNLDGMNNIISVLSGRVETVILLDQIREKYGNDPDKWLPIFYEAVKTL